MSLSPQHVRAHLLSSLLLLHGCGDTRSARDAAITPEDDASVVQRPDASAPLDAAGVDASEAPPVECFEVGANDECSCWVGKSPPTPVSSCDEDYFAPQSGLCCATSTYPSSGSCTCTMWGCDRLIADDIGCGCGRAAGFDPIHPSCSPGAPDAICCAAQNGVCHCYRDSFGECPADRVQVARCDITTALCSVPGFVHSERVTSCSGD